MDTIPRVNEVAGNVSRAIAAAGENSKSIARATGIPRTTLLRRLSGDLPGFTVAELDAISLHLNVPFESFLTVAA
jgi:hypothetical protein